MYSSGHHPDEINGCVFINVKWKQGYLQRKKLWKYCMIDDDESATAFVMQWRWPIKHKTPLSVMRYTVISATILQKHELGCRTNVRKATLTEQWGLTAHSTRPRQPQSTVGHFVWSDHRSLQSCSRSALVAKATTCRPKPWDQWTRLIPRHSA